MELQNEYIRGEERSFTIIAFPTPEIGPEFPEIFDEVIKMFIGDCPTIAGAVQPLSLQDAAGAAADCRHKLLPADNLQEIFYYYVSDYTRDAFEQKLYDLLDPASDFALRIVEGDLSLPYRYPPFFAAFPHPGS